MSIFPLLIAALVIIIITILCMVILKSSKNNTFIKDNLLPNEQILAIAKWHSMKNWCIAILLIVLSIVLYFVYEGDTLFFSIVCLVLAPISYFICKGLSKYEEFVITNFRVIAKVGVVRRIAFELHNDQVESIEIRQGIFGRIFGYGTLIPGGVGASKVRIRFVKDPFELRQHFYDIKKGQQATRY